MRNKTVSFNYLLILLLLVIVLISTQPINQSPLRALMSLQAGLAALRRLMLQSRLVVTGYLRPGRKSTLHFELLGCRLRLAAVETGRKADG